MDDSHKAAEKVVIPGEDRCLACNEPVEAWDLWFESGSEGYEKVRRCSHCRAISHADSSYPGLQVIAIFFVFVPATALGIGGLVLWMEHFLPKGVPKEEDPPVYVVWIGIGIIFAAAIIAGQAYSAMKSGIKHRKYGEQYKPVRFRLSSILIVMTVLCLLLGILFAYIRA